MFRISRILMGYIQEILSIINDMVKALSFGMIIQNTKVLFSINYCEGNWVENKRSGFGF